MGANKKSNFQKCGIILIDVKTIKSQDKSFKITCGFCKAEYNEMKIFSQHLEEKHSHDFVVELVETAVEPGNSTSLTMEPITIKAEDQPNTNDVTNDKLASSFTTREAYPIPLDPRPTNDAGNEVIDVPSIKREHGDTFDEDEEFWDPQYSKRFQNSMTYSDEDMDTFQRSNEYANEKQYMLDDETSGTSKNVDEEGKTAEYAGTSNKSIKFYSELFSQPPIINVNDNNTSQVTEILSLLRKMDEKLTILDSKTNRLTVEVTSIRNDVSLIKTNFFGEVSPHIQNRIPSKPFISMEQYLKFENEIENDESFKELVKELSFSSEKSYDKFIRNSWRKLFTDELAEKFSWRGTTTKKCIRGARTTLAIRHAFKNKFALKDEDFDSVTQKYFQYAHDRMSKSNKYKESKRKLNEN